VKPKNQRLTLSLLALAMVVGAGVLAVSALKNRAAYFYAPSDAKRAGVAAGTAIRLGGMVADKSIARAADGVTINFVVEDATAHVPVRFKGITPDLFREKSGVIAEGAFDASGVFVASTILAKHDEKYVPPELAGAMHKTGAVK
jgi:cytochrome c-type biogenesis protein CcmE